MKTLYPDLFPETLLVSREGDRVFTTSLKVAEHFHKRHTHVLRAIEKLLGDLGSDAAILRSQIEGDRLNFQPINEPNFGLVEGFNVLNFERVEYKDKKGETRPMYHLGHDGFALVAMGFTGREALAWKVKFLAAFREMERQLHAQKERESNALFQLRPKWQPIILHPEMRRAQLIGLTGHKSPGSITACRARMRQVGML